MSLSKQDSDFWRWVVLGGVKTNWVICREGCLIRPDGRYASNNGHCLGYLANGFNKLTRKRHRLVATAFVVNPRPDIFKDVDHIDGNIKNNNASNLRWVNKRINMLNKTSKSRCMYHGKFAASIGFMKGINSLGTYRTEQECLRVCDYTRKSVCVALYHYHTRPNTFLTPDKWVITPNKVRVCRI